MCVVSVLHFFTYFAQFMCFSGGPPKKFKRFNCNQLRGKLQHLREKWKTLVRQLVCYEFIDSNFMVCHEIMQKQQVCARSIRSSFHLKLDHTSLAFALLVLHTLVRIYVTTSYGQRLKALSLNFLTSRQKVASWTIKESQQ